MAKTIIIILAVFILVTFFFIWPGISRYKYFPNSAELRLDRITGKYQLYDVYHDRWKK